jgi:hypothetical protein
VRKRDPNNKPTAAVVRRSTSDGIFMRATIPVGDDAFTS